MDMDGGKAKKRVVAKKPVKKTVKSTKKTVKSVKTVKKTVQSDWTKHLKKEAKARGITYGEAMASKAVKNAYKKTK
jgi:hypothetical protein